MLVLLFLTGCLNCVFAQHRDIQLEDSIIGWSFLPKPGPYKDFTSEGFTRTAGQLDHMNKLIGFMMRSYQPVGGTGTFRTVLQVSSGKGNFRPHSYWIDFRVWDVTYDQRDAAGKFTGISEQYHPFRMRFNSVGGWLINFLNSATTSFFTWPGQLDYARYPENRTAGIDPRISPNCYPFIVRNRQVILARDNQLPFHAVTIGEFLQAAEKALPAASAERKLDPSAGYPEYIDKEFARHAEGVRHWRNIYANRLNDPAVFRNQDITPSSLNADIDPFYDPGKPSQEYFELYQWNDDAFVKAKKDQPLFLTFDIPYNTAKQGIQEHELTTALQENVNFQYIYDYFFYPDRVKGKTYVPSNAAGLMTRLSTYRGPIPEPLSGTLSGAGLTKKTASTSGAKTRASTTDAISTKAGSGELLNEAFISTADGRSPVGWYTRSFGEPMAVTSLEGLGGKWLKLGVNNKTYPTTLPKTLPQNFMLDLDVATSTDFSSRTGAHLRIRLSNAAGYSVTNDEETVKESIWLELDVTAGQETDRVAASNFMGSVKLQLHEANGPNVENKREGLFGKMTLPQFTGADARKKIHVTLKMMDGKCTVLIDGKELIKPGDLKLGYDGPCVHCALSPNKRFTLLNFTALDDTGEGKVHTYISNVKLVKI